MNFIQMIVRASCIHHNVFSHLPPPFQKNALAHYVDIKDVLKTSLLIVPQCKCHADHNPQPPQTNAVFRLFVMSRILNLSPSSIQSLEEPTVRMADADNLLMETSDQNGNEGEEDQNGADQELMAGEEEEESCQGILEEGQGEALGIPEDIPEDIQEDIQDNGAEGADVGADVGLAAEGAETVDGADGGKIDASKGEEDAG